MISCGSFTRKYNLNSYVLSNREKQKKYNWTMKARIKSTAELKCDSNIENFNRQQFIESSFAVSSHALSSEVLF